MLQFRYIKQKCRYNVANVEDILQAYIIKFVEKKKCKKSGIGTGTTIYEKMEILQELHLVLKQPKCKTIIFTNNNNNKNPF